MKTLSLDLETFSDVDLSKCGVYKYASSPAFEILLFGYSIDGGDVQMVDLACGGEIPADILTALEDERVMKWAYNAQFERICLSKFLGFPVGSYLDPSSWHCSMVWAATLGLPMSLENVGVVLGLEKQKLTEGKDLIRYFCVPCKPTKANGGRMRNLPEKDMYYMENHHPAIVSRETFDAVTAVISQRGKEKGVTSGSKYQSRYPFSGRIICSECGGTFKRRIHYSTHQKYIAWCCSRHIEKKEDCSMQFIRNDAVEAAFTTMMNKLVYGHRKILRPLLDSLRRVDDDESYHRVNELEDKIEAVMERGQVLAGLMTKGYLEPALFSKEKNELAAELDHLQGQKDILIKMMNGNLSKIEEVSRLLKFASKSEMLIAFDSGLFEEYVNRIIVYSRTEVGFELKCGITLKERLVR